MFSITFAQKKITPFSLHIANVDVRREQFGRHKKYIMFSSKANNSQLCQHRLIENNLEIYRVQIEYRMCIVFNFSIAAQKFTHDSKSSMKDIYYIVIYILFDYANLQIDVWCGQALPLKKLLDHGATTLLYHQAVIYMVDWCVSL
jgi:hypothetical protein